MHHPRPDNIICNLCQQSAEKYFKGFLIQKNIDFPKTYDIVALLELAKSVISVDSIILDKCS
jgi:HEPN domain-containing protein